MDLENSELETKTENVKKLGRPEKKVRIDPVQERNSGNVLVHWKEKNILTVGSPQPGEGSMARLLPGINRIPRAAWNYLKQHPIQKLHIEDDEPTLVLVSNEGDVEWDEMPEEKAKKMIPKLSDIMELETIRDHSSKKSLKKVASDRIKEIMKAIKPKED